LLGVVVGEELPELSEQKANLVIQNAAMNKQLYDIGEWWYCRDRGSCARKPVAVVYSITSV
jgi:hypothetical protein